MFQMKEQEKLQEKILNEMKITNLSDKEFKVMDIKMFNKPGKEWINAVRTSTKR